MPSLIQPSILVNITIQLTDGDAVYDVMNVHPGDLGKFNEAAQRETDGELWWEPVTQPQDTRETVAVTAVLRALAQGKRLAECNPHDLWYLHGWLETASTATDDLFRQVDETLRAMQYEPASDTYDGAMPIYHIV